MVKKHLSCVIISALTSTLFMNASWASQVDLDFYGSLRLGIDNVDAGIDEDGLNGRDYLSRVGIKAKTPISDKTSGVAIVEYGLRADNLVDEQQNEGITLRVFALGLSSDWGELLFGSQTTLWEHYVGHSYFADGNDSVRQHAVRDDDLLQYYLTGDHFSVGAGVQMESQDGDDVDQVMLGGEYRLGPTLWQLSYSKDNRGENTGSLSGARIWWDVNPQITLSSYTQRAGKNYDLYAGSSSGNVRVEDDENNYSIVGIVPCVSESRQSNGVFGQYHLSHDTYKIRYAVDHCDLSGNVESTKLEYLHDFSEHYSLWAALEDLHSEQARKPATSSGDDMSEVQLGMRIDF